LDAFCYLLFPCYADFAKKGRYVNATNILFLVLLCMFADLSETIWPIEMIPVASWKAYRLVKKIFRFVYFKLSFFQKSNFCYINFVYVRRYLQQFLEQSGWFLLYLIEPILLLVPLRNFFVFVFVNYLFVKNPIFMHIHRLLWVRLKLNYRDETFYIL
jgi:hypothetical protein